MQYQLFIQHCTRPTVNLEKLGIQRIHVLQNNMESKQRTLQRTSFTASFGFESLLLIKHMIHITTWLMGPVGSMSHSQGL
jgi:hypothetical protein